MVMTKASESAEKRKQEFERVLADASTVQATFEEEQLPLAKRIQRFLHLYPTVVPFVVLILGMLLGLTVNFSHFATGSNLSTVLTQVTIIGFLGIAQTLVILTAGIDLSVGVIMVISAVVMGRIAVVDGPAFLTQVFAYVGLNPSAPVIGAILTPTGFALGLLCGLA